MHYRGMHNFMMFFKLSTIMTWASLFFLSLNQNKPANPKFFLFTFFYDASNAAKEAVRIAARIPTRNAYHLTIKLPLSHSPHYQFWFYGDVDARMRISYFYKKSTFDFTFVGCFFFFYLSFVSIRIENKNNSELFVFIGKNADKQKQRHVDGRTQWQTQYTSHFSPRRHLKRGGGEILGGTS